MAPVVVAARGAPAPRGCATFAGADAGTFLSAGPEGAVRTCLSGPARGRSRARRCPPWAGSERVCVPAASAGAPSLESRRTGQLDDTEKGANDACNLETHTNAHRMCYQQQRLGATAGGAPFPAGVAAPAGAPSPAAARVWALPGGARARLVHAIAIASEPTPSSRVCN
jgi:hypothetical protein